MNTTVYSAYCNCEAWSKVINAIPGICWGILIVVALYYILKFVIRPLMMNCHERKIKEQNCLHEKEWFNLNSKLSKENEELKRRIKILETPKEEEECRMQLVKIEEEKERLEKENTDLNEKCKELENKALQETIKAYQYTIKHFGTCTK